MVRFDMLTATLLLASGTLLLAWLPPARARACRSGRVTLPSVKAFLIFFPVDG